VTIPRSRMLLAPPLWSALLLGLAHGVHGDAQSTVQLSPADLIKAVISTELKDPNTASVRWKYVLEKEADGKQETREVVETKAGSIDHLVAISGKPLSDVEQRNESQRIQRLSHNAEEQRKLQEIRRKDAEQCNAFLKMIPDAFLFAYTSERAGPNGDLVKLTFRPNPSFQPPSREGKVMHEMAGEIWVDARQRRLVSINGQLLNDVKFAGGLFGHLEKGGRFSVKRAELAPGDWEMTEMEVNMHGKALLFKTICVQQKELHRNFERVPEDLTFADAAALLMKQSLIAAKR
jgi:hypothetical protein